jgi:hypothetical protein
VTRRKNGLEEGRMEERDRTETWRIIYVMAEDRKPIEM